MNKDTQADSDAPAPVAHTPEPWFVGDGGFMVLSDSSNAIAIGCDHNNAGGTSAHVHTCNDITPHARRANLARIVACVNACVGIPTGELHPGGLKITTMRFFNDAQAQNALQKQEIVRLRTNEFSLRSVLAAFLKAATSFDNADRTMALAAATSAARRLLEREG